MRGLPSSIRPLELLPSLLAPRSVVPLYLDPRTRTRRRAAVFGSGATASFVASLRGVTRGPAGASAGRRGRSKRLERAGQALRPSFKSWSGVREPCAAGAPGRAPQSSAKLRSPWGLCTGRHGSVHVARDKASKNSGFTARSRGVPPDFSVAPDGTPTLVSFQLFSRLARPGAKNQEGDCHKAPRESA